MANLCSFLMEVKGDPSDIEAFVKIMRQEGNIWMGRGADASIDDMEELSEGIAHVSGSCKWSIQSSLIDNALSMRNQKETGKGLWAWDEESQNREYLSLWEACEKFNVNMEVYSEEPGCEFQEHYKYENGAILDECVEYREIWWDEDEDFEQWKKEYDIPDNITEDDLEDGCYYKEGGFEDWDFDLADIDEKER